MKMVLPMAIVTVIVLLIASYVGFVLNIVYGQLTQIGRGTSYNPLITQWKKAHSKTG
jgi:hypothetical protein